MSQSRSLRLRIAVAGLACLTAIASAPVAITTLGEHGVALPGLTAAQQVMAMLDARSPGERDKGALTQTKSRKQSLAAREAALTKASPAGVSPVERLARAVAPPPIVPPFEAVPPLVEGAPLTVAGIVAPVAAAVAAAAPLPLGGAALVVGGGAPPVTTVADVVPTPLPATSAMPEPQSWFLMLFGFALAGSALRRRTASRPALA